MASWDGLGIAEARERERGETAAVGGVAVVGCVVLSGGSSVRFSKRHRRVIYRR